MAPLRRLGGRPWLGVRIGWFPMACIQRGFGSLLGIEESVANLVEHLAEGVQRHGVSHVDSVVENAYRHLEQGDARPMSRIGKADRTRTDEDPERVMQAEI